MNRIPVLLLISTMPFHAQAGLKVLECEHLVDVAEGKLRSDQQVLIEGDRIAVAGSAEQVNEALEAPTADAANVRVMLEELSGPEGSSFTARPASDDDLFRYTGRNIELFFVRYLEIQGLSTDSEPAVSRIKDILWVPAFRG